MPKEFDIGLATWRMTIGDFGRNGHMARLNWAKTCSFDRVREDSGPTLQMARGEWRRRLSGVQLASTNLGADWLEGLRTGPRRAGLEREKRSHLRALEVGRTRPKGTAGGQTSRLARVMEKGQAAGPRGAHICPLIGPCGRVDPAWLAEL